MTQIISSAPGEYHLQLLLTVWRYFCHHKMLRCVLQLSPPAAAAGSPRLHRRKFTAERRHVCWRPNLAIWRQVCFVLPAGLKKVAVMTRIIFMEYQNLHKSHINNHQHIFHSHVGVYQNFVSLCKHLHANTTITLQFILLGKTKFINYLLCISIHKMEILSRWWS